MSEPNKTLQGKATTTCYSCKKTLEVEVLPSSSRHFIGYICKCGAYNRKSDYYTTKEEAQQALDSGVFRYCMSEHCNIKQS